MHDAVVLFSGGAGAWELGCEWAGVRVVASCEADPLRREMLAANFPDHGPIYDDVRTLTAERIRVDLGLGRDWRPWLVGGSPPCQDASYARHAKRTGLEGERTGLFRHHVRLVLELRSDWMGAENVAGFTPREQHAVLRWLGEAYRGWALRLADEDVGAPHRAERSFTIARRIAPPTEETVRRRRQPRDAAPALLRAPAPDQGALRAEIDGGGACEAASHAPPHEERQHHGPVHGGSLARCAPLVGSRRRVGRGHWGDHASADLCRRLRVAAGLPGGLARAAQEALGDAFPPQLAQAWILAMKDADAAVREAA